MYIAQHMEKIVVELAAMFGAVLVTDSRTSENHYAENGDETGNHSNCDLLR